MAAPAGGVKERAAQMEGIPGLGEKKRAGFGDIFAREIAEHLRASAKIAFA